MAAGYRYALWMTFGAGPGGRTSLLAQLPVYEILRRRGLLQGRDVFFKASNV